MQNKTEKIWCVVPAAGVGSRMQAGCPKQYLNLGKITILDATLTRLLSSPKIEKIVVCINTDDAYWQHSIFVNHPKVTTTVGGEERSDTVLNGINRIKQYASASDWLLVHDAARPCVTQKDIELLIDKAQSSQLGAILAAPIHDTVKKSDGELSTETLDRSQLWRALTPQIFKLEELEVALVAAKKSGKHITDEASAIEHLNKAVQLVEGRADNIKITTPADLNLAKYYIAQQGDNK
ncbi:MAG: 2-C-methyl-D-erythritol 4-phosphate cytidylyltransferase [Cycloclasticus sp. symbiont of Bathymodiolus heckerae]|nr:MAG: 2-C-methyl-D-erythritol 4-phosphate cytidylyltransferase [Cycloclasticus sp. symbiont of Bathymodiolus heckerae]